jgi:tetratricopeptide (TPR) repeat protein
MIGQRIGERYYIEREISRGGRGVVYQAMDTLLQRRVAVKVLVRQDQDPQRYALERQRLLREAQAVGRLNHPNIVTVYDLGETGGAPFIVMELVEGQSLASGLVYPLEQILALARQMAAALDCAHSQGIIHRDLKPENILLTRDGTAKLSDFGLARTPHASRLTQEGAILGTVFYLAPEQALGRDVDPRADLYSLGVVLYEMATGRLPFLGNNPLAVISQHIHAPLVPPRAHNPGLPPGLEAVILELMSKQPEDRPTSALSLLQRLETLDHPSALAESEPSELSLLDRIARGRLIGRMAELTELKTRWSRAVVGEAGVVGLSGEPGVGKTRLVRELAIQVQIMGGRVLQGSCYAEGGPPYAPIAQVIQAAVDLAGSESLSELPDPVLADLVTLHPSLAGRFPGLPRSPSLGPQAEQQRMSESLARLIELLAGRAPLLFILEDAHWADPGALVLVRNLARRFARLRQRLLILLTFRQAELEDNPTLADMLLEVNRERLLFSLHLLPLSLEECGELLEAMFAEEVTPEFQHSIFQETEGNPFFIEEVCKALIEDGQLTRRLGRWHRPSIEELRIPTSLRVVIQARLQRLPAPTRQILLLAAVIGREFDFETLHQASGEPEEDLLEALALAEKAQLVGEVRRRGSLRIVFSFAHALIPMVLREVSGSFACRRLHRQVAAALQVLRPDDYELLAYHLTGAGDGDGSRRYHTLAGDRARQLAALEDAAAHYRTALETWPRSDPGGQAGVLEKLGECLWLSRGSGAALEAFEQAYERYQAAGLPIRAGEMQRLIGRIHWEMSNRKAALDHYQQALQILEAAPESVELARAFSSLSQMDMLASNFDGAIRWGEQALELAGRLGAEDVLIHSLNNIGSARCHVHAYNQELGLSMLRDSLHRALALNLPHDTGRAYLNLGEMLESLGRGVEAAQIYEDAWQYFQRIHAGLYEELFLVKAIGLGWQTGRWAESLPRWSRFSELNQGVFAVWIRTISARLNNDLGQAESACQELEAHLAQALESDEAQTLVPYLEQLARAYAALGQPGKVESVLGKYLERIERDPYFFWGLERPLLFACQWYAGRPGPLNGEAAQRCLAGLEHIERQMRTPATAAALAAGRAALHLSEQEYQAAQEHYQAAALGWQSLGRPLDLAHALAGLGNAQAAAGRAGLSRESFDQALALLHSLAAQIEDPHLRASFQSAPLARLLE